MVDREYLTAASLIKGAVWVAGNVVLMRWEQYWVTYAFLTVIESAINAVYWFPFYYTFKFILVLWMALPQTG